MRSRLLGVLTALMLVMGLGFGPGANAAPNYDRTCGVLPGDGYLNFIRVKNMGCHHGMKVAHRAVKKFCSRNNDCSMDNDTDFYKGKVVRNGWRCKVAVGWEYERVKCRKGSRILLHMSGA